MLPVCAAVACTASVPVLPVITIPPEGLVRLNAAVVSLGNERSCSAAVYPVMFIGVDVVVSW